MKISLSGRRRTSTMLISLLAALLSLAGLNATTQAAPLVTYVVTNTNDSGPNSLRQAILNANSNTGPDTIDFNIPGTGVQTIVPLSPLPPITDPVTINGYSQPGSSCNTLPIGNNAVPLIELNGNALAASGIVIVAGSSTVRGLIINRFGLDGIELQVLGGNTIAGNFIGTNATATGPLPNGQRGIQVATANNFIGSASPCDRNVISGNAFNGVHITGQGATNNTVFNNYIGTGASGSTAIPNNGSGVLIQSASNNQIGSPAQGTGNVISGNEGTGIIISDNGFPANVNRVRGNLIGTQANGTGPLGNTRWGVQILSTSLNQIGGAGTGAGNTIAFNMFDGIMMVGPNNASNVIRTNSIHSNTDLGIDLLNDGVTPNDTMDPDGGPNALQNYPVLGPGSTTTVVQGTFNSTPSSTFTLEFFYNITCDPSNFGEGETPDGTTTVTTDAAGNATFSYTLPNPAPAGSFLTATATDAVGNTSEFSQCRQVQPTTGSPTPTCPAGQVCSTATTTFTSTPCPAPGCNTATPTATPTCPQGQLCASPTPTSCGAVGCATPSSTATRVPQTSTSTSTVTSTSTGTSTRTPTATASATTTATTTATNTPRPSSTPTCAGQACGTNTPTQPSTSTATRTSTRTSTSTATRTSTSTSTRTPSATPTCIILGGYTPTVIATATIIIGTGSLGNHCNDCVSPLIFPFPVQFYGDTYQKAVVSSNGNVQFSPETATSSSECLPNPALDTAIMLYQGDLDTSGQGEGIFSATLGTAPNRIFALEWRAHYPGRQGTANAELIFYENSSNIEMVYGANTDEGANQVSGMQFGQGEMYSEYSCNQPQLTAGKKIIWIWHPHIIICTPTPTSTRTSTPTATATACIQTVLQNGFETGTLEGYTSAVPTCVPGGCGWTNVTTAAHTGTRSMFAPDVNHISDQQLISPAFNVPSGSPQLTFWHRYALEHPLWDGGIIEISPNGGPWATITPSAISPTYPPGVIPGSFSNPLVGKRAWTNSNPSWPLFDQITVNLSAWAGTPNTRFRFRLGTDIGNYGLGPALGWWIDDIKVTGPCNTPTATRTRTATRTPTPPCVQPPPNMTHWYPLDETSGVVANELIFGANATKFNGPVPVPGMVANGLSFNGSNQYASVLPPWNSPQLGTGDFSIDMWINVPASSLVGTQVFLDGRDFAPRGYEMFLFNGRLGLQLADTLPPPNGYSNYIAPTQGPLANPGWHFIAATVSRTVNGGRLWVDGVPMLTFTPRMGNLSSGAPLWIGRHHPNASLNQELWFRGSLDEIEFFRRALSANEILNLYNAGAGGKCKPTPAPATPTPTQGPCWWCLQDIQPGHTFYLDITNLAYQRVVNGYPCGGPGEPCGPNNLPYFRSGNNITRGQIAKIVAISAGFVDEPTEQTFEDVPPGHTFYLWVEQIAGRGHIAGYACGGPGEPCIAPDNRPYFRPGANATRGQLSKIIANAAGIDEVPGAQRFEDIAPGSTFYNYINPLAQRGVINGYACGSPSEPCGPNNLPYFRPGNSVTRGQASKMDARVFWLDDWIEP